MPIIEYKGVVLVYFVYQFHFHQKAFFLIFFFFPYNKLTKPNLEKHRLLRQV